MNDLTIKTITATEQQAAVAVLLTSEQLAERLSVAESWVRDQRARVAACLKARNAIPPMLEGARLVRWEPRSPPIVVTKVPIVPDVCRRVSTLLELKAAMAGKRWLAGNRSEHELINRLEECGVAVQVNETPKAGCE